MPKSPTEQVLDASRVSEHVFAIFAPENPPVPVSIDVQQIRAMNLVHSLFYHKYLEPGMSLAVVGGGFAGITAAAYAAALNAKVTLFEQFNNVLNVQEKASHRWVCPGLTMWPTPRELQFHADLPVMDWQAGTAREIVEYMRSRWKMLVDTSLVDYKSPRQVNVDDSGGVSYTSTDDPLGKTIHFDRVIVAVGLGSEGLDSARYWDPDALTTQSTTLQHYAIAGLGDGAVADVLRVRLGDMDDWLPDIAPYLSDVAEEVRVAEAKASASGNFSTTIRDLYTSMTGLGKLEAVIGGKLRPHTRVTLLGLHATPFDPKACPLNRLLLYLVAKLSAPDSKYKYARVSKGTTSFGGGVLKYVDEHEVDRQIDGVDTFVQRFGPRKQTFGQQFKDWESKLKAINHSRLAWTIPPAMGGPSKELFLPLAPDEFARAAKDGRVGSYCSWVHATKRGTMRKTAHRDHQDRSIVISRIGAS
jgi:hypothetical protein